MIIAMWSGPRNLSTAMMYAFAQRAGMEVVDEPFYAAYLAATGLDHPMRDEVLASQPQDPRLVADQISSQPPSGNRFLKLMTHHMLPEFPTDWMAQARHVFLIRHPARVIASYVQKRETPTLEDLGFTQQMQLFDAVRVLGREPVIIDADEVLTDPEASLRQLCSDLGLAWDAKMLTWPKGGNKSDGIWARHWYNAVHESTGLAPRVSALPEVASRDLGLLDLAMPYYESLKAFGQD
ncbi:MAG: HAD family hydrolase [Rhodobacteraceae bacterium]|nr:HAD family hydrolase [Paracoccaceae bacterium]